MLPTDDGRGRIPADVSGDNKVADANQPQRPPLPATVQSTQFPDDDERRKCLDGRVEAEGYECDGARGETGGDRCQPFDGIPPDGYVLES